MAEPEQSLPPQEGPSEVAAEETPNEFMRKAMASGLTAEEINRELQARYNVDLSPMVKAGEAAARVFRGGAPEGMRPKTIAEEVTEPFATGMGMVGGAVKGMYDIFEPTVTEAMIPGPMGRTIAEGQRRKIGKELRDVRADIDKQFREREGESIFENLRSDLRDNAEGVLEIINVLRAAEDFTADNKDMGDHLKGKMFEGADTGRQFAVGMGADIWSLGDDPAGYFHTRPFTSGMMLAGPLGEVKRLAKANFGPAVTAMKNQKVAKLQQISDDVSRKLKEYGGEPGVKAAQKASEVARTIQEAKYKYFDRWTQNPFSQRTERASNLVESLIDTANRTGKSVQQIAARWAEMQRRGIEDVSPAPTKYNKKGVQIKFDDAVDAVGPKKAAERWETPDRVKVPVQEVDYNPTTAHFGGIKEASRALAETYEAYKKGLLTREQYDSAVRAIRKAEAQPHTINIKNTHWQEAAGRFIDELSKVKNVDIDQAWQILNTTLADRGIGMLRSDLIKKAVIDRIMVKVRESGVYTPEQLVNLEKAFPKWIDEFNKRDPSSASYRTHATINFDGVKIKLADEVLAILDEAPPKERNAIYSELIAEAAGDIAQDTRLNTISDNLKREMPTFATAQEWIDNAIERTIIGGEDLPSLIQDNPHHLATRIIDNIDGYAKVLAKSDDPAMLAQAKQQLRDLAHKMRSYKRVPEELAEAFGIQDHIRQNKPLMVPETKAGRTPAKLEYEVFAPEGVIDSLKWEWAAKQAVDNATGFWDRLNRHIKGNLTARNIASAINNLKANFVYQTFRRGEPFLAATLTDMIRKYHAFRTGKSVRGDMGFKLDPFDTEFFKAMERTGILDTTMLDAELGGLGVSDLLGDISKPVKKATRKMEEFYKAGDNIFKLEESRRNYKKLHNVMDELQDGEFITVEVKDGRHVKLTRRGDKFESEGVVLEPHQVNDIVANAASLPAQRIFFDYTNVPNAVKWVRASKALGVTSPFFTWFWKAVDIPGMKRGLMREMLSDGVNYSTNNKKLNMLKRAQIIKSSARRHAMLAGVREAVKEPNNSDTLRKALAYSPREFNLQLLDYTTNPTWIGHDSEESANQFGPSDILVRAIMSGMAATESDQDILEVLYPKEHGKFGEQIDFDLSTVEDPEIRRDILIRRKLLRKHHSNEAFTPEDAAQLIGVSGSPILDGVIMLREASRQGGKVNTPKLMQMITTALVGGTWAALGDIAVASMVDPNSPSKLLTTRRWAENEIGEPEEKFIKWAIRRMTGIGFRPLDVGQRSERYFKNKEREWKESLTGDLRELLEENPELSPIDRDNINQRIIDLEKIVEGEMMLEKLRFDEVFQNIRKNVKRK